MTLPEVVARDIALFIHTDEAAKESDERCKMATEEILASTSRLWTEQILATEEAELHQDLMEISDHFIDSLHQKLEVSESKAALEANYHVMEKYTLRQKLEVSESKLRTEQITGGLMDSVLDSLQQALERERKAHAQTKRNTTRQINSLKRKLEDI